MSTIILEQVVYRRADDQPPERIAQSPDFPDELYDDVEELIVGFGDRPIGVSCPAAVFAQPLGSRSVAIVQVADREMHTGNSPVTWFRVLVVGRKPYEQWIANPFVVDRRLTPDWDNRDLQAETWPQQDLEQRTVGEVNRVLMRLKAGALPDDFDPAKADEIERTEENSESPALLGGVQILVDGGRIVFQRPNADSGVVPSLWTLLPHTTRSRMWPASFAFGNQLGFDAIVVARINDEEYEGYSTEETAETYPAGRYEMSLQAAAEAGDQSELDRLFARRSLADTWKLGIGILIFVAIVAFVTNVFVPKHQTVQNENRPTERQQQAAAAAGIVAVHDPITATVMISHGKRVWSNPKENNP